jgi:3-methyladenine DNA glycosylase AlkD
MEPNGTIMIAILNKNLFPHWMDSVISFVVRIRFAAILTTICYLKIVGNNKLWPDMQKDSWNIHGTKNLICSHTLNGTDS